MEQKVAEGLIHIWLLNLLEKWPCCISLEGLRDKDGRDYRSENRTWACSVMLQRLEPESVDRGYGQADFG